MSVVFDGWAALDGNCLDGMRGKAGVLRQRFYSSGSTLSWDKPDVRYFPGAFAGHAIQINPKGDLGFLGGWHNTGRIFSTRTLEVLGEWNSMNAWHEKLDVDNRSPTHMVFPHDGMAWKNDGWAERTGITTAGPKVCEVDLSDLPRSAKHFRLLADHELGLPHALKPSATGKYIFCGAADYEPGRRVRRVGIYNPAEDVMQIAFLPATCWHIQTHPTKDIMYAVTENYEEGDKPHDASWSRDQSIPVEGNFLFEVTPNDKTRIPWIRDYGMDMDLPSTLSSDIVVKENADGTVTVYYNACASATIVMIKFEPDPTPQKHWAKFVDESVGWVSGPFNAIRNPGTIASFFRNFKEARWRGELFSKDGKKRRWVEYVTRKSIVDGSYGLMLSPDDQWLISAHRGINEFLVYKHPEVFEEGEKALAYRVPLPPIQRHLPKTPPMCANVCRMDPRLGLHHCVLSTATVW